MKKGVNLFSIGSLSLETLKVSLVSCVFIRNEHMNETGSRILDQARILLFKLGVRNVTMDDIARELGMSKKTIYQFYQNKAEIVYEVAKTHFCAEEAHSEAISREAENAIDEEFRQLRWAREVLQTIAPNLAAEIRKYYPKAWGIIEGFQNDYLKQKVTENLTRGIAEGLYRPEIDLEVVAQLRLAQMEWFLSLYPVHPREETFSPMRIQLQLFDLYMHGIVSDVGRPILDAYLQEIREGIDELKT